MSRAMTARKRMHRAVIRDKNDIVSMLLGKDEVSRKSGESRRCKDAQGKEEEGSGKGKGRGGGRGNTAVSQGPQLFVPRNTAGKDHAVFPIYRCFYHHTMLLDNLRQDEDRIDHDWSCPASASDTLRLRYSQLYFVESMLTRRLSISHIHSACSCEFSRRCCP